MASRQMKANAKLAQAKKQETTFQSEGLLGRMPDDIESIAELMLQDSDINVY